MATNSVKQQVKKEIDSNKCKTSKAERRRKAGEMCSNLTKWFGPLTIYGGLGETKLNVMSNADRRRNGLEEDESLEDFQGKKT